MRFQIAYHSDIGNTKKVNQDVIGFKEIEFDEHRYALAIVCDGMGGLQKGEMVSATVIKSLLDWFEKVFPSICEDFSYASIQKELEIIINKCNKALHDYGVKEGLQLGTTLSALLIRDDGQYLIANVGDSRIYLVNRDSALQLTEDQTFVAREIMNNRITDTIPLPIYENTIDAVVSGKKPGDVVAWTTETIAETDLVAWAEDEGTKKYIESEKENDDLYTLRASAKDLAGNVTVEEIKFSVNRFG